MFFYRHFTAARQPVDPSRPRTVAICTEHPSRYLGLAWEHDGGVLQVSDAVPSETQYTEFRLGIFCFVVAHHPQSRDAAPDAPEGRRNQDMHACL